jgi:4-aminobutyrate aminotransferase / (S)-3-amino-2-methylpropionate transaminase / 5-aminovalerate transaminase
VSSNAELMQRRMAAVPRGLAHATPVFAARAANAEVWDTEGKRYIDFAGGIAVLNTGHCHPRVMAAIRDQLERFTHTAFQVMPYEPYVALAERLNALAPFSGPAKTAFFCSGAEAVENAVKIARCATGRSAVIAFTGGFHGRTLMTMALTGKVTPYKRGFGPLPNEVFHIPFPAPHYGVSVEDSLRALDSVCHCDVDPARLAAIIIEPVQGEGGFNVAPKELLQALRRTCDENGSLLIADEVQTGFARTGRMFGIEHSGVAPDLVAIAKSMAGGLPLGGVIGRAEVMDATDPGGLGSTFGGNPVACAAGLAVLDVIEDERLLDRATEMGARMRSRLEEMSLRNDLMPMAAIRGLGAMVGFDIVSQHGGSEPDAAGTRRVTMGALERGLVVLSCGVHVSTIRILVPLTAPDAIVDEGMDILQEALRGGVA